MYLKETTDLTRRHSLQIVPVLEMLPWVSRIHTENSRHDSLAVAIVSCPNFYMPKWNEHYHKKHPRISSNNHNQINFTHQFKIGINPLLFTPSFFASSPAPLPPHLSSSITSPGNLSWPLKHIASPSHVPNPSGNSLWGHLMQLWFFSTEVLRWEYSLWAGIVKEVLWSMRFHFGNG